MISVTKTYMPSLDKYTSYLKEIWETGQITNNGPFCRELCKRIAEYLGVPNIELVANGTLALQIAIKALNLTGEVITTPFSYVATANAIAWEGCTPVFVDIDESNFCIDPSLIESAITKNTSAILATHVYGYPCEVQQIRNIANKYNLKVIYDAAHCFGVKLYGKSILLNGDISILSFHATKLFHTAEGGAVICKSHDIANAISLMKKFGHIGEEHYLSIGINAKMSELHAAMGLCVLPKVQELINKRRICARIYDTALKGSNIRIPQIQKDLEYNYAYYPVVFSDRIRMQDARKILINNEIYPRRYFYPSINRLKYLCNKNRTKCPVSESIAERVLVLPVSHKLDTDDIERIAELLIKGTR